jgi:hypothetical protein
LSAGLQAFADLEARGLRRGTVHGLAGARVASGAGGAGDGLEGAETNQANVLTRFQRVGDGVDEGFQSVLGLVLVDARLLGDRRDEFGFCGHVFLPA